MKYSEKYIEHILSYFKEFHEAMKKGGDETLVTTIFSTLISYAPGNFQEILLKRFEEMKNTLRKIKEELSQKNLEASEYRYLVKEATNSLFYDFFRKIKYAFDIGGVFKEEGIMSRREEL